MSTPNEPTFGQAGKDTQPEPDLLLQPIPKATRFRRKLVYALLGTAIAAVSVIFTYGLMKSNHHDIIGAGKAHENTAATVPDISDKLPKNYSDVSDLAAKQRKADAAKAGVKLLLIPSSSAAQSPTVRLHLDLEPGQRVGRYRASLANRAGGAAWDGAAMRAAAEGFVEIDVPSAVLADGDYILTLDQDPAGAAHESYVFRVQRKP